MQGNSLQVANQALSVVLYSWLDHQDFCQEQSDLLQNTLRAALPVNAIVDGVTVTIGSIAHQSRITDTLWFNPRQNAAHHPFAVAVHSICRFEAVVDA